MSRNEHVVAKTSSVASTDDISYAASNVAGSRTYRSKLRALGTGDRLPARRAWCLSTLYSHLHCNNSTQ